MESIKSRSNQFVKFAKQVRGGKIADKFFVEGSRLVGELYESDIQIESLFLSTKYIERFPDSEQDSSVKSVQNHILSSSVFDYVSGTKSPQGIAAVCQVPADGKSRLENALRETAHPVVAVTHNINNPGNLGAVMRSAEAFGAAGLVVTDQSANPFGSTAVRGSMGAVFRLPIWKAKDLRSVLEWGNNNGLRSISADASANRELSDLDWSNGVMVVLGSEGHGLDESEIKGIDENFRIEMAPGVESLNLAVAAGIIMFEYSRRKPG